MTEAKLKDSDRYLTHGPMLDLLQSMWPSGADLDPFHDPAGPRLATSVYDIRKGEDAYVLPWIGRTYVNGPYSVASRTAEHIVRELDTGEVSEVISVCPAAVGSAYWRRWVWPHADAVAFAGRLAFAAAVDQVDAGGRVTVPAGVALGGNRTEIAVCYYGPNVRRFRDLASTTGWPTVAHVM